MASNVISKGIILSTGWIELGGHIELPKQAKGMVLFAHGSGSSRFSQRNRMVAQTLNNDGFGTLLFDLLTTEEASNRSLVFNIPFLAERLIFATQWVSEWLRKEYLLDNPAKPLPIGYFGASTGAGAALWAASQLGDAISAVVSRGGRPDLATLQLPKVTSPTLLIVGGNDDAVIEMNRDALLYLVKSELVIIPGASHLFEEPGALESVSQHASAWFSKYLTNRQMTGKNQTGLSQVLF